MEPVFPFDLTISSSRRGTLVHELHHQLRTAILDGRLAAGASLPATREVASALNISRNTVVSAYDLLIAEGYVNPRTAAKAVVTDLATRRPAKLPRISRQLEDLRLNPLWRASSLQAASPRELPNRNFRLGMPDHRYFPYDIWRRLSAQSLRRWSKSSFSYPPSEGIPMLREAIAQHVAFTRAVACTSGDVMVTSGSRQAFDLVARLLVTPGKTRVAVEEPGYPPVRTAFAAAGAVLVPVPVDDEGLCVDQLPDNVQVISVTPSHQSPTGVALSLRRRTALLDFARSNSASIIEDDYDGEFRFGNRPLDALQTMDRDELVFYVGTFSKSLFPSLRKGFVVAPAWAREALKAVKHCADSHCDTITQSVLAAFINDGHLARYVRRIQPIYAARRGALIEGLHKELSDWLVPIPSEAGLHLAARIRSPKLATKIFAKARLFTPGAQSIAEYSMSPPERPALAFGYGVIDVEEIPLALARLRQAIEQ